MVQWISQFSPVVQAFFRYAFYVVHYRTWSCDGILLQAHQAETPRLHDGFRSGGDDCGWFLVAPCSCNQHVRVIGVCLMDTGCGWIPFRWHFPFCCR